MVSPPACEASVEHVIKGSQSQQNCKKNSHEDRFRVTACASSSRTSSPSGCALAPMTTQGRSRRTIKPPRRLYEEDGAFPSRFVLCHLCLLSFDSSRRHDYCSHAREPDGELEEKRSCVISYWSYRGCFRSTVLHWAPNLCLGDRISEAIAVRRSSLFSVYKACDVHLSSAISYCSAKVLGSYLHGTRGVLWRRHNWCY